MNADLGEISLTENIAGKSIYTFEIISEDDLYCYCEVVISENHKKDIIYCYIPYQAKYKPLKIRFKYELLSGAIEFVLNPINNREWFNIFGDKKAIICLSEYRLLSENNFFALVFCYDYITIYGGNDNDMGIKPSLSQNETFLLKAFAGNLYQHPTTGTGLINFLHCNFENSELATKLKKEFESDGMIINNAYMNSETGELLLEVVEKNG